MSLQKKPFTSYTLEEERKKDRDRFVKARMNVREYAEFVRFMKAIHEPKPATALKKALKIAYFVAFCESTGYFMRVALNNKARNERTGAGFDAEM